MTSSWFTASERLEVIPSKHLIPSQTNSIPAFRRLASLRL